MKYAGASGDFNPMQHDEPLVQAAGMPSVFGRATFSMGLGTATPEARLIRRPARGKWTGLSDEGVAHRAERRCSEGEKGFVEAPEREFRTPRG